MTCIVGYTDGKTVTLGGDSCASDGSIEVTLKGSKVFKWGPLVVGSAGGFRGAQLLRFARKPPKAVKGDAMTWLVSVFAPMLAEMYGKHGVSPEDRPTFLIGLNGELFEVDLLLQVLQVDGHYQAIGSGADAARAALWAVEDLVEWTPIDLLERSLSAASAYTVGVAAPFTFVQTA